MNKKILIVGGSGLIGGFLTDYFKKRGEYVGVIARKRTSSVADEFIEADTTKEGRWQEYIQSYDIVINLVGATIGKRWNRRYKEEIYSSRILTTRNIVNGIEKGVILFSTSAVGYYGDCKEKILTEESRPCTNDFLHRVCEDWEREALEANNKGARVFIMRFGVVASSEGGAFQRLIKNHKYFLGSVIGSGKQFFSYIHIEDIARGIEFLIDRLPEGAIYNFTTPHPVTNRELTLSLSSILKRPVIIPFIPSLILRLILGEFADTLLFSQRAMPENLLKNGFEFKYPTLMDVLSSIVRE
jgi:uncharacterized protein (TIGR01777 family)